MQAKYLEDVLYPNLTLCQSSFKGVPIWVISPRITCYVRNLGNLFVTFLLFLPCFMLTQIVYLQWNNLFSIDIKWFTLIPDHLFGVFLFISVWTISIEKAICNNGGKYQRELFDLKLLSKIISGDWGLSVTDNRHCKKGYLKVTQLYLWQGLVKTKYGTCCFSRKQISS